ncbi:CBS domain-containing protein [Tautonia rosea]|uniref:CBS domain-containing protein n=1 Tax=Tautonia rosea TaxID=2728037 RepID=UPI001472AD19|nr:CBS domain-containing protein [Tautonia rosea]
MSVGRICTRVVELADPDESVRSVATRMVGRGVGTLVVTNAARHPIGLVTDRDLVARVLAEGKSGDETTVLEVMTRAPSTVDEETPIERALELMRSHAIRRLPVVGGDGVLIGLVSLDDILSLLAEEFRNIGTLIEKEMPK